jgi:hypothetical protein
MAMNMTSRLTSSVFTRPDETRFADMKSIMENAKRDKDNNTTEIIDISSISFWSSGTGDDIKIFMRTPGGEHEITSYMLNKICVKAGMRKKDLYPLTPATRTAFLNEIWQSQLKDDAGKKVSLLMDDTRIRTMTSTSYKRIWDYDLLTIIDRWAVGGGFQPAVPTINKQNSNNDKPALFRSDRDMFTFFFTGRDNDSPDDFGGLRKGLIVRNSEVGDKSIGIENFIFREVCGNFLIWGMEAHESKSRKHIGNVQSFVDEFEDSLRVYAVDINQSDWDLIEEASKKEYARDKETVIKKLQKKHKFNSDEASRITELAEDPSEGAGDYSVWSVSNAVTAYAKTKKFEDERLEISRKANSIMESEITLIGV